MPPISTLEYGLKELPTTSAPTPPVHRGSPPSIPGYTFAEPVYGGIDGEEFMGTGTGFQTDEEGPVYTPGPVTP